MRCYTILGGSSGPISIGSNMQKVGYEPARDFEPIALASIIRNANIKVD